MEASSSNSLFTPQIKQFAIKAAIVFLLFTLTVSILMPDLGALASSIKRDVKKAAKDEKTRTVLLSFIENPAALYRVSEIEEKDGKLKNAVMQMELAIGLLEMHNTNQPVINRYTTRLNSLKEQLKNSAEPAK